MTDTRIDMPKEIDGVLLTPAQQACVAEMVLKAVFEAGHHAATAVEMATDGFRRMHRLEGTAWKPLPSFRLANGRVVKSKFYARQVVELATEGSR